MGRKVKYSKELKLEIVKRNLNGESAIYLAEEYNLKPSMKREILKWAKRYKVLGERTFEETAKNKTYSKELKEMVIKEYLEGRGSLEDLSNKYNISTKEIVRQWILKYNRGIEIKDYNPKGDVYTMKSRKTTIEERKEIVKYVKENDYDYKGAADKYAVPYTNVYQWVKKYLEQGEDGLNDRRGRPSSIEGKESLSEVEKLQIELEAEKAKNERLERTIVALKKKEEIEQRMEKDFQKYVKKLRTKQSKN
ncbi:MAG: helix-turn-helix domain-containing protein [Anaeroplasmataceae bacterium]|nr:helix-turn-helix domain-containing protein [Anaeroplasmataceae bacterium]